MVVHGRQQLLGREERNAEKDDRGHGEQNEDHSELAQGMPSLPPSDCRLREQVAAEHDGPEDNGLARDGHGCVRAAVARVVSADDQDVDILEYGHHGERHPGDDEIDRNLPTLGGGRAENPIGV